jgi:hypothetical protein
MAKLPAFQFYPGDWRKDVGVQSLDYFDRGVWHEMLCLMHESERRGVLVLNGQAMNEDALARLLGLDKQTLTTTITTLLTTGVASREAGTGALMCRRMVRDEKLSEIRRDSGKKGGNPALLNQNQTTLHKQTSNQKPTPSSSSSTSTTRPTNGTAGIDANMAARGLCERLNLSRGMGKGTVYEAVYDLALQEEKRGGELEMFCERLAAAYELYLRESPQLEYNWGPAKFFAEGHWQHPELWPRKGREAPKIRILDRPGG